MKKVLIALLLLGLVFSVGCGKDGSDGKAYLQFDWVSKPLAYSDNNSSVPGTIYRVTYYQVVPGTYNYSYTAWDSSKWSGTYTISVNSGDKGTLFTDGSNGADKNFTLYLYSIGPSFYGSAPGLKTSSISESGAEIFTEEKVQGNYKATVTYQRVQ